MTAQLTLISHHLCPYVQRAAIALAEKGVPFQRVNIDLADKPDWFLRISPSASAAAAHSANRERRILFETGVICEYLEETQTDRSFIPAIRCCARAIAAGWSSALPSLADLWVYETTQDPAALEAKRKVLQAKFATMEAELAEGPYFAAAASAS